MKYFRLAPRIHKGFSPQMAVGCSNYSGCWADKALQKSIKSNTDLSSPNPEVWYLTGCLNRLGKASLSRKCFARSA